MSIGDLTLRRRLSEPTFAKNIALNGIPPGSTTESVVAEIYWTWADDPAMEPIYLGRTTAGNDLVVPDFTKGKSVYLYLVGITESGVRSVADIRDAERLLVTPPAGATSGESVIEAGESLTVNDLVSIYDDSGTRKVRKADATDNTRPCHGFVISDGGGSLSGGDDVRVLFVGSIMTGLSGLTPGAVQYLSETAGGMTATPPSGSGKIVQHIGVAVSATEVIFDPEPFVELIPENIVYLGENIYYGGQVLEYAGV